MTARTFSCILSVKEKVKERVKERVKSKRAMNKQRASKERKVSIEKIAGKRKREKRYAGEYKY